MNVWELYQLNEVRANKDQSGRSFTYEQFNAALQGVNIDFLKLKYGLPEEYKPGMALPRQAWEVTQKITDDLRACKVIMGGRTKPLLVVDQYGFANLPSDYIHYSALRWDRTANSADSEVANEVEHTPIDVMKDGDFDGRLFSKIKTPWSKYPFCRVNNNHIEFRPLNIRFAVFSYIRMPRTPYLAVTVDGNNDYVYDAENSVELEWPVDAHIDIANLIFQTMSENLSNPMMYASAQKRKVEGI